MTMPSGRMVDYSRDGVRRIQGIDTTLNGAAQNIVSNTQYRGDNQVLQKTFGNGLIDERTYDLQGRLLTQQLEDAINTIIDQRSYSYDKNSNVINIDTNLEDNAYGYDKLDRLTSDTIDANNPFDFTYDQNDNRLTKLRQDMSLEEFFEHQLGSNRLSVIDSLLAGATPIENLPNRDFIYNDVGRLFQLIEEGSLKAEYIYNDAGQRTRKTIYQTDGITVDSITIYHYDQMGYLITETDETGQLIKDYIWQEGMHPVAQIDSDAGTENIIYLYTDHLMTNRLATDEFQSVVWRWEGEAFGNTPAQEFAGVSVNLRFPGQYFDSETNLHYNYYRYYDPQLGRYITSDPIGLAVGMNTYNYVRNNPMRFIDPLGLESTGEWIEHPYLDQSSIDANYIGWEPTFGLDHYATLLLVRLNFNVSGNIVASVRCEDECGAQRQLYYNNMSSTDEHIDLGLNILGSAGSFFYGPIVGLVINAIVIDLKLNEGLQGMGKNLEAKAAILNEYGPDMICNNGWPSI